MPRQQPSSPFGNLSDEELLARVQQIRSAIPSRPEEPVAAPPPTNQQPYLQAEQLEQQARPPQAATGWRGIGEAVLRGLASTGHPGGFSGYNLEQQQLERQRQQDLLTRAQQLRGEGMQRDRMNLEAEREQRLLESSNAQLEETRRLRGVQESREAREASQPTLVPAGAGLLHPGEKQPSYTQPFAERQSTTPQPTANIQEYNFYSEQETKAGRQPLSFDAWQQREATRRPTASAFPVVIQTPSGPQLLNRGTGEASPITSGGSTVGLAPTADMRNRALALGKAGPVLNSISELSEKINIGQGLEAKAVGEVEKAKARLNYNDDVAEYDALVQGFTPLIARAVGHTGVLTEQDVQSVRALFPKPGDSKTLRDRKIARLNTILAAVQQTGEGSVVGGQQPAANQPNGGGGWKIIGVR